MPLILWILKLTKGQREGREYDYQAGGLIYRPIILLGFGTASGTAMYWCASL